MAVGEGGERSVRISRGEKRGRGERCQTSKLVKDN